MERRNVNTVVLWATIRLIGILKGDGAYNPILSFRYVTFAPRNAIQGYVWRLISG